LKGIEKALESGELEISDEEYEREYEWRQDELFKPEKATVRALVFPVQSSEAGPNSAEARKMLVKGAPWEEVVKKFTEARQAIPLQTTMVNAGQPKFQSFWEQASGAQQGKILGPLIVEDWEMVVPAANGQTQRMPLTGYLVAEVLDRVAPEQMTLEEAKQQLAPELYYVKYLKQLREEAGVDIDEEKLPEPGLFLEEQEATI
jgi:hypothetical protein